jgi:hypothetical protein
MNEVSQTSILLDSSYIVYIDRETGDVVDLLIYVQYL